MDLKSKPNNNTSEENYRAHNTKRVALRGRPLRARGCEVAKCDASAPLPSSEAWRERSSARQWNLRGDMYTHVDTSDTACRGTFHGVSFLIRSYLMKPCNCVPFISNNKAVAWLLDYMYYFISNISGQYEEDNKNSIIYGKAHWEQQDYIIASSPSRKT